ncbi:MAG: ATP-dependent Clp protease proteolytic subunit [Synergistales bacterium]|nr:ATP-dependent Clp protease proteolytic subunit [Synergistales bacterium]
MEFFWILFLILMFQPVIKQKMLNAQRQRTIRKIEREHGSRVVLLVHRQETMGLLGLPMFRYIDVNDSEEVLRAIHMTDPETPLEIVLHTPGGLVLASLQIARAIHMHEGKVTVYVPHYAMSGGTLIALAADEIVMCENAVLGPVDPQIGQWPAASIRKVLHEKPIDKIDDETLILADQSEKAISQIHASVLELLADKMGYEKAEKLAELLAEGTWTHDHPITFDDAEKWGLPVSKRIPEAFVELLCYYPQPVRRSSPVEYTPEPRRTKPRTLK